jgi:hypothetical protein
MKVHLTASWLFITTTTTVLFIGSRKIGGFQDVVFLMCGDNGGLVILFGKFLL